MYEQLLMWAGFVVLLFLCLPFPGSRKLILEVCTWALRLALVVLLAAGAILWFRPELLPAEVANMVDSSWPLKDILPEPGSQSFGLVAATLLTAVLLPLLAIFNVTRQLAGRRLHCLRRLADEAILKRKSAATSESSVPCYPLRSDRRGAAETIGQLGSRKPYRVADDLS